MLPKFYKFHAVNNAGATIECSTDHPNNVIEVFVEEWKIDGDGAVEYAGETTALDCGTDLADGSAFEGAAQDNSAELDVGLHGRLHVKTDATVADAKRVDLYVEWSTDGGTTYPSDSGDFVPEEDLVRVTGLTVDGSSVFERSCNFVL